MKPRDIDVAAAFLRQLGFTDVTEEHRQRVAVLIGLMASAMEMLDPDADEDDHLLQDAHKLSEALEYMAEELRTGVL
jgi:hypothetical protein